MIKSVLNLFYPRVCSGCEVILLSNEIVICTSCRHEIPLTNHHKTINNEAFNKFYGKVTVEFASAMMGFHKKGIVQEMIHKLKYKGHEEIGEAIGNWYFEDLKNIDILNDIDLVIPVPLHSKKLKERGYNQVTTFGKALSKNMNVAYEERLLIRKIYSKTQTKKTLLGRTEVVGAIFDVEFDTSFHNKHFLLIDDVITTGSTLEACCNALLKIPGARVSIVCMAMSNA